MTHIKTGFTLSELLIALAILGIVAAFTIPKLLESNQEAETAAKVRETVAALENAWYSRKMSNTVLYGQTLYDNLVPQLNVVAASPGSIIPTGLLPAFGMHPCTSPGPGVVIDSGWVQFHNGVIVTGIESCNMGGTLMQNLTWAQIQAFINPNHNFVLCMDTNGGAGPNEAGRDIFFGNFNQYGGFSGTPTSPDAKSFNWGNTSTPDGHVYDVIIGPSAPYSGNCPTPIVGEPCGDNTRQPPAVAGAMLEK